MYKCLRNTNLISNICRYLNKDSIIQFSQCNRTINKALNPKTNSIINLNYLISINKTFFEFDEEDNNNTSKKKNLLSKLLNTKINWKTVLNELSKSFKNYNDEKITQKVLDCFRIHIYLPDIRKENFQLDYISSSIHQTFCYDNLFKNACTFNYYDKFITKEYMMQDLEKEKEKNKEIKEEEEKKKEIKEKSEKNNKVKEIKILREGLYFENELKDFRTVFDKFINNIEYKNIIFNAVKYNYEILDYIYENDYYNKFNNNIIKLILWITHSFILYSKYIYKYISSFNDDTDEKTILMEFFHKHNEIINCALLLNSNFENINIIINQFIIHYSDKNNKDIFCSSQTSLKDNNEFSSSNKNISLSGLSALFPESKNFTLDSKSNSTYNNEDFVFNIKDSFSFYKLFLNIIKKNIYDKLSTILNKKFIILINKYYKNLFENFQIKDNKNDNKKKTFWEENHYDNQSIDMEDDDDLDIDEDLEEDSIEKEPSEKEIIEGFINCIVDFTINERNSNGINHTELKITKEYENFENIIIENFKNYLQYYMNEDKPNSYLFEIIEKISRCDANQCNNLIRNRDSLMLIRRTKKRLMQNAFKLLLSKSLKDFGNSFLSHIKINNNNEKYISLTDTEIKNNNEYKCDLRDLSTKKRMKVTESVMNEINSLKFLLKEENIKAFDEKFKIREIENLIDLFFNCDGIQEVLLVKKMIWFYYRELGFYEEKNEKIVKILNYRKDSLSDSFEEKKVLLN